MSCDRTTFFERPILNSPYECPARHWELDETGQPTQQIIETPPARRVHHADPQAEEAQGQRRPGGARLRRGQRPLDRRRSSTTRRRSSTSCAATSTQWRSLPNPSALAGDAGDRAAAPALAAPRVQQRPAVLLPGRGGRDRDLADRGRAAARERASASSNTWRTRTTTPIPSSMRLALKLATGAGKTTVMAMLIAWQTVNAVRRPAEQALHPRLPRRRARASRSRTACASCSRTTRTATTRAASWCRATCSTTSSRRRSSSRTTTPSSCASGWSCRRAAARCSRAAGEPLDTLETEGQMLQRVMPELMGMKNILVLNDEAHHCYREKPRTRRGRGPEGRRAEGGREEQRGRPRSGSPASRR